MLRLYIAIFYEAKALGEGFDPGVFWIEINSADEYIYIYLALNAIIMKTSHSVVFWNLNSQDCRPATPLVQTFKPT